MKQRKTIAVDIDDVLSKSAEGFIAFSNEQWGMSLKPEDYQEEWAIVWGVPLDEALRRSVEFHASGATGRYEPNEMAMPALKKLAQEFDLVAVTSRRVVLKPETDAWIDRHFPHLFKELHYAGIWDDIAPDSIGHALKRTKAELCREIGADYLIDDQIKHCTGAAGAGVAALLFGANPGMKVPAGVTPVQHWKEVEEYFHV
jgi:5'(3')-deoxyribonucleotidase